MKEIDLSFQGPNNAEDIKRMERDLGGVFVSEEIYKAEPDGHKYSVGQKLKLHGLEDYPQYNGMIVEITAIREDGPHGRAYYMKSDRHDLALDLNWTYEYRLKYA